MLFAMPLLSMEPCPKAVSRDLALKKIHDIACAGNYGPDDYCDDGSGKIVKSKIGDYREAGPKMFSRFVFRTPLNRTGLHLVRITYPDDKTRTCEIFSWSPLKADLYNAQTGYFSGRFLPISHRMQEHEYIIWAHHTDHAVVFTTWLSNEPAAAARIEVFEIEGRLPSSKLSGLETERLLGLYWEDPNSFPTCFGSEKPNLEDFDIVAKNLCDYLDYTGQNVLFHPAVGYDGPIYNSLIEPRGGMGGKYLPAAGHLDILINRFEERSLKLFPTFNVFSLNSLLSEMNADIEEIKKGKETFNVVDKDNVVYLKAWVHKHPTFNALQPWVQKKIKALVNELAERYGSSISFSGIAFHLNMPQPMYLGGLDSSYDDFTISWFERESGIIIPVDKKDPERFSRRYTWLINNKKEIWITWRCRKITDYYNELAEILKKQRSDLKLVIAFLEPPMPIIDEQSLEWQNGKSLYDSARETGIDPVMLAENPNIIFIKYMGPCDTHKRLTLLHRGKNLLAGLDIKTLRAIDFADEQLKKMRQTDLFGLYFQNRYFETDIGKKEPLKSSWFKSIEWRASAVVPAHDHFMEYYSRGLAVFDPMLITSGGFTTGTVGHEKKIKKFAEVYRLLPVGKWNEITNVHKNAVVRWLARDNKTYLYAVNSGYEKITISIPFKEKRIYTSLGNSPSLQTADSSFKAELGPYELAGWVSK
ncbi:MAG TPA: hypothetical protein DC049_08830 [Spirochaetia bacterium]|nr:hypothetical protein [Spirochaetia bacterium]